MWPYLSGKTDSSPRDEIFADYSVLISGKYKIFEDAKPPKPGQPVDDAYLASHATNSTVTIPEACFPGPIYPNATVSPQCNRPLACENGACLFDLESDPNETNNLSGDPAHASVLAMMKQKLNDARKTFFNPDRKGGDPNLAGKTAVEKWGGFWGPFIFP